MKLRLYKPSILNINFKIQGRWQVLPVVRENKRTYREKRSLIPTCCAEMRCDLDNCVFAIVTDKILICTRWWTLAYFLE